MTNQISTDASPDLKHPFYFFLMALAGLTLTALYLISQHQLLNDRWDNQVIAFTHFFTLLFLLPVTLGALTQLIPVVFGINLKFQTVFRPLTIILPVSASVFLYAFHIYSIEGNITLILALSLLWTALIHFAFQAMKECLKCFQHEKNFMHLSLVFAFGHLITGLLISFLLVMAHYGLSVPHFRPGLSNLHFCFMIAGFFFNLIHAVTFQVVPMFFVTSNNHTTARPILILVNSALALKVAGLVVLSVSVIADSMISVSIILFAFSLMNQLQRRKRKKRDPVIFLWFVFALNLIFASLFLPALAYMDLSGRWTLLAGLHLMTCVFIPLILAMLMKIIPFLHWMHLGQESTDKGIKIRLPHMKDYVSDSNVWVLAFLVLALEAGLILNLFYPLFLGEGLLLLAVALTALYQLLNAQKIYQIHLQEIKNTEKIL